MKHITKPFGQPEPDEAKAVRMLVATPGFAQAVEDIEYLDGAGNVVGKVSRGYVPTPAAAAERFTLTDAGAVEHDAILTRLQEGRIG